MGQGTVLAKMILQHVLFHVEASMALAVMIEIGNRIIELLY